MRYPSWPPYSALHLRRGLGLTGYLGHYLSSGGEDRNHMEEMWKYELVQVCKEGTSHPFLVHLPVTHVFPF